MTLVPNSVPPRRWAAFERLVVLLAVILAPGSQANAQKPPTWKAGTSRTVITPREPMWMSGYASRDHEAEGTLHDLWCKVLILEDARGHRGAMVSLDLVGIDRSLLLRVQKRLVADHSLTPSQICLATSHTHTGPVAGTNLNAMYFLNKAQSAQVMEYDKFLEDTIVNGVTKAIRALAPATLRASIGKATFAVNRRENREADVPTLRARGELKGPVDHDVPVVTVWKGDELETVLFGYACHATTLSFYKWSGDWPGFAQIEIEKKYPGATAMFFAGCGADQNPLPRRTVELARDYGSQIAATVHTEIQAGQFEPIAPSLATKYREISLPFATPLDGAALMEQTSDKNKYVAGRARVLLKRQQETGEVLRDYPYPVQVWQLGEEVDFVMLGGEVVVDYSRRLKNGSERTTFVGGYMNDVMAYIPSERVLKEGRYEGEGAMVYYGLPSAWSPGLEDKICELVELLRGRR